MDFAHKIGNCELEFFFLLKKRIICNVVKVQNVTKGPARECKESPIHGDRKQRAWALSRKEV